MTEQPQVPGWRPTNRTEQDLIDALGRDDRREFFRILSATPVYLPQTVGDPTSVDVIDPANFITFVAGGVTYLLAFSSVETLREATGHVANGYVESDYPQLREYLAGSDVHVAFNLGTPIDAWLDAESVALAAAGEIEVPTGAEMTGIMALQDDPANAAAVDAAADEELNSFVDDYLTGLIDGDVLVPTENGVWRVAPVDGVPTLAVFSSADLAPPGTATVSVAFTEVVSRWPERAEQLAVNPDTPLAFAMPADVVGAFAGVADLGPPDPS